MLADHRLSIGRSITNLRAVADALRNAKGDLQSLLETGPRFLTITADLVADQKQNLDCLLTDLAPVLRMASSPEHLNDLRLLLEQGPTGFGYVFSAIDHEPDGPWIRVNLVLPVGGTDPKIYIAAPRRSPSSRRSPRAPRRCRRRRRSPPAARPEPTPSGASATADRPVLPVTARATDVLRTAELGAPVPPDPMAVAGLRAAGRRPRHRSSTQRPRHGRKGR